MFHGTNDNVIPIGTTREGRDALLKAGFQVDFHEFAGYEHNTLCARGDTVVGPAWEFLKTEALDEEPRDQVYSYQKP